MPGVLLVLWLAVQLDLENEEHIEDGDLLCIVTRTIGKRHLASRRR